MDSFNNRQDDGWFYFTGDGDATMDFVQKGSYARIAVDATQDQNNVWWAIIKRNVAASLDLEQLSKPDYELRVEAKVRLSNAPRRINFMINTNRTTNFHKQLREYDIADTTSWHVISMTTNDFDVRPGDSVYVQLGVTDWGRGKYHVDLDYYKADVVNKNEIGPDKGEPLVYHPPIPDTDTFTHQLPVTHDALVNTKFPKVNFNDWHVVEGRDTARVLTVSSNQWAVMRWDFGKYQHAKADGPALLELTTQGINRGGDYIGAYGEDFGIEFGKVRVIEILGGDPGWNQKTVTYKRLTQGKGYDQVFNTQMIYDIELSSKPGSKNYITLSRPVIQRLLDGTTKGLLIRPLGAIDASVYASESKNGNGPKLFFNTKE